ncbi:MAG: hypothetical protein CMC65_05850 [Flavobacteriaceae bacterium]|nr:hypothetical protein [Flavobacteriaceae bacterium]
MAAVGPSLCGFMGVTAIGPLRGRQACVLALPRLTGPLVTLDLPERGPVLAWSGFLLVKSWYISGFGSEALDTELPV